MGGVVSGRAKGAMPHESFNQLEPSGPEDGKQRVCSESLFVCLKVDHMLFHHRFGVRQESLWTLMFGDDCDL